MFLFEANDLIVPYLDHPNYDEFEKNNPELQELVKRAKEKLSRIDPNPLFGKGLIRLDEETENIFLEIAETCEAGLK